MTFVAIPATFRQQESVAKAASDVYSYPVMLTIVVTSIRKGAKVHLFIKEHMEALKISDEKLAGRLGVARETVWRRYTQQNRLNPNKIAEIANALGLESEDLYRPPGVRSLDAMLKGVDEDTRKLAADLVSRIVVRK